VRPLTEQKLDKEALAESEARFRQVAEMAGEWLWEQDPEGHYIYSSDAVRDILEFTPLENPWQALPRSVDCGRSQTLDGSASVSLGRQPTADPSLGQPLPPQGRTRGLYRIYRRADLRRAEGKLIKWRGVDHDITARKAVEDARPGLLR